LKAKKKRANGSILISFSPTEPTWKIKKSEWSDGAVKFLRLIWQCLQKTVLALSKIELGQSNITVLTKSKEKKILVYLLPS
jgi:hypothetical protein